MPLDASALDNTSDQDVAALRQRIAALEATVARQARDVAIGQSLCAQFPDSVVFVFDTDLRYLVIDGPALATSSLDPARMRGATVAEVLSPEAQALIDGPYRAALRGETTTFTGPFEARIYRTTVFPLYAAPGQIVGGIAVVTNVTTEVITAQRHQMFEQVIAQAPDGVFVRQADGTILYANPAMEAMIGTVPLRGTQLNTVLAAASYQFVGDIGVRLTAGHAWSGRLLYQRADGTTFPGRATVFAMSEVYDPTGITGAIVHDVTVEEQADQARQAQLLAVQQARIRELATPLIPLASEVIAMPLVGTIDSGRAQQIMETLLEGIVTYQAAYAILDITGVKMVDTQVAQALLRIAQAAKLLGTQMLLSGVGMEIALTLTQLDLDLTGIIPVANLQSAITYALAQRAGVET